MKKLMTIGVVMALAAVSHAASINWTITNVYSPSGSAEKIAVGTATALLFVTANSTDVTTDIPVTTMSAVQAVLDSGNLTGLSGLAAVSKTNGAVGGFTGATGLTGFSSGALTAFVVVVDSTDLATANNYFIAGGGATKDASFTSATGMKMLGWGDQTNYTQGEGKWTALVPEPTSGLLLLLGMAGLALRRKAA